MVCEMENMPIEEMEEMDIEALPSMWPEDIVDDTGNQFKIEGLGGDQDMLEEVTIPPKPSNGDLKRLSELFYTTDHGSAQLETLAKHWQYRHANAVRLLTEELDILSRKKQEIELKKLEIIEEHRFEEERYCGDKRPISILDDFDDILMSVRKKHDITIQSKRVEIEAEYDTAVYWKQRAMQLESLLDASMQREQILMEKLQESIQNLEGQSTPLEELQQIMQRADNYLHFILKHAPVVIGHQDKELRYRFIYNHFPTLQDDDILGKTDMEIFTGSGVKESQEFKREVLEKGLPAKREITFETELFGSKTFLIYVEPVFSKSGETIGINYMGMDVTDQVIKREKMAKLREEIAVQKAKETELNKTIHITEETMRAKQMLATMSHEIRSPLSGVVSMAEILSTTILDHEQRQLIHIMISSGDIVLQLINDILDLSKVESGVMKLEATKFRPREVVKHVLQTAAASLQKTLTLEGHVADNVPVEVIGDVLRIRQILTNLISNAVKFTHEGKVAINLYVVEEPSTANGEEFPQKSNVIRSENIIKEDKHSLPYQRDFKPTATEGGSPGDEDEGESHVPHTVWICCDVHDTGIGIPENALPTLFKKYMQVSADHARKYGGTGLGLAICKQLVELMGGRLTVTSKVNCGSTFTFILPYKVSPVCDDSDDSDELGDMGNHDKSADDVTEGFFQFQPRSLGSLFSTNGASRTPKLLPRCVGYSSSQKLNGFAEDSYMFPNKNIRSKERASPDDVCSIVDAVETLSESECSLNQSPHPLNEDVMGKNKESREDKCQRTKEFGLNLTDQPKGGGEMYGLAHGVPPKACLTVEASDTRSDCLSSNKPQVSNMKSNPKILLVEDNKVNVMVTRSMMKQLGHKMDVVNNGVEAVRAVQKCSYDLILMDVCMPVMDGLQATRLIRSFEETGNWDDAVKAGIERPSSQDLVANDDSCMKSRKRVPIIAMTANALSESADECFANGMDSFVSKPVTFQNLKQCLEQYLQ